MMKHPPPPPPLDPHEPKVYGIGFSKTGTTTLSSALGQLGYRTWTGHWQKPENFYLLALYIHRDYDALFRFSQYWNAFTDAPWGGTDLYEEIVRRTPNARFILTVRDPETWYTSLHKLLTMFDLNEESALDSYYRNGMYGSAHFFEHVFDIRTLAGNKRRMINAFQAHNDRAIDFLSSNNAAFAVLNFEQGDEWNALCGFLGKSVPNGRPFPFENRSADNPYLSNREPPERSATTP